MANPDSSKPAPNQVRKVPLFVSKQEGYDTYRIPALAVTTKGTILAFCEGRKGSSSDSGGHRPFSQTFDRSGHHMEQPEGDLG